MEDGLKDIAFYVRIYGVDHNELTLYSTIPHDVLDNDFSEVWNYNTCPIQVQKYRKSIISIASTLV